MAKAKRKRFPDEAPMFEVTGGDCPWCIGSVFEGAPPKGFWLPMIQGRGPAHGWEWELFRPRIIKPLTPAAREMLAIVKAGK